MAEAYVDQGAYATNIGATPTWGVPQEGDGSATSAAAASAVGSILFNAVPTTGNFVICGVTFTSPAGVLSAASVDAAANALAGLINASTTAVGATVAYGVPQLRNLVFARGPSGGAAAGTCEIMMRVGSTTLNHASNSNVAMSHTFNGTAPTLTQFIGGTGGCWGWTYSNVALGVSGSIASGAYGIMRANPMVRTFVPTMADSIIVRTGRNLTISSGMTMGGMTPMRLVFDDGTTWTGDSPTGALTFSATSAPFTMLTTLANALLSIKCRALGGLTIKFGYNSTYQNYVVNVANGSLVSFDKVSFVELSHAFTGWGWYLCQEVDQYGNSLSAIFKNCLFDFSAVSRSNMIVSPFKMTGSASNYGHRLQVTGCEFRWALTGNSGVIRGVPLMSGWTFRWNVLFQGNTFSPGAAVNVLAIASGNNLAFGNSLILQNNDGLDLAEGAVGLAASLIDGNESAVIAYDNMVVDGSAKYETRNGYSEVVPGRPVLTAAIPNGSLWAWSIFWSTTTYISDAMPYRPPQIRFESRLSTAARTLVLEWFIDPAFETQLEAGCVFEVVYPDGSGGIECEEHAVSLASSAVTWANTAAAPYNTYSAFKTTITTRASVPLNAIVSVGLRFDRPASGSSTVVVLNPEPGVT